MSFAEKVVVFFLIVTITNSLVTIHGGCANRQKYENFEGEIINDDPNQYYPMAILEEPKIQPVEPIKHSKAVTKPTINNSKNMVSLDNRNNFGDLPKKCGPNEEKIHGECREV